MYTIGQFSKIGSVSTKTLRYYDEIGLIQPAYVDQGNHYRYYSEEQVYEILFVSELKGYDLRLEQIKAILNGKDIQLLERFLEQRIKELDSYIQGSIKLKNSIEKKLKSIQVGGVMMNKKLELVVEEKIYESVLVVGERATIEISNISSLIGSVYEKIFKYGFKQHGPVMTFYHDKEFNSENADVEVCIPIENDEKAKDSEYVKLLKEVRCGICEYVGPYSRLGEVYATLLKWIEENNYEVASAPFDCYMNNPQEVKSPKEFITKVCFPIK